MGGRDLYKYLLPQSDPELAHGLTSASARRNAKSKRCHSDIFWFVLIRWDGKDHQHEELHAFVREWATTVLDTCSSGLDNSHLLAGRRVKRNIGSRDPYWKRCLRLKDF
jgi:hypothetical protein